MDVKIERGLLALNLCVGLLLPVLHLAGSWGAVPGVDGISAEQNTAVSGVGMPDQGSPESDLPEGLGGIYEGSLLSEEFFRPQALYYSSYRVVKGDTIGELAQSHGLNQDTLLSFNGIKNSRLLQIGQFLKIPNQDGLLYTLKKGETLASVAEKYKVQTPTLRTVNVLGTMEIGEGAKLFIPGARLSSIDVQEINGDLFIWPVRGHVTSPYGYRISPFTGARQFHSGLDIGAAQGTPIRAAMAGRVSATGYDVNSGNYIVITHHSGYRTFYGHLDVTRTSVGAYVKTGDRIGDVGSTGLSTGSHLHFTVFKNGVTVNPRSLMK